MPQIFRIGPYIIYFWSNEGRPLEPVHVHIANGRATANATKIWITRSGKALLCNNSSKIPENEHLFRTKKVLMGHSLGTSVTENTYGHRNLEELRTELEKTCH